MLLRRVMEHLMEQDWTAVVLDFVIVVVGVVLGIEVSNWNAGRIERAEEAEIIEALISDLEAIEDTASRQVDLLAQHVLVTKGITDFLRSNSDSPDDPQQFQRNLDTATTFLTAFTRSPTTIELISSGKTGLIRDRELRTAIIRFDQFLQASLDAHDRLIGYMLSNAGYVLTRIEPVYEFAPDGKELLGRAYRLDVNLMRADPLIVSSLTEISSMHFEELAWRRTIIQRAAALRARLEAVD